MKKYISNNRLFLIMGFAVLFLAIPFVSASQADTLSNLFKTQFNLNLNELDDFDCWLDNSSGYGKIKNHSAENIELEFQYLNFPFFNDYLKQTELYYQYLEDLEPKQKQKLIWFFTIYEKEFETVLEREGLPIELKYLAPALSAMNTKAVNEDKRTGVWQLTHFQAVLNGIQINKLVDERFDVSLATIAASKQIKQNLELFDNLDLAVTAYLLGNVKVQNAIQLAEKGDAMLRIFLPESFYEKVATIQAMAVFLNLNRPRVERDLLVGKNEPDTAKINRRMHFQQVAEVIGISMEELQCLNPQYKYSIVPGDEMATKILIPKGEWDDFVLWQDSIYNYGDSSLFQLVTQKIEYPPSPNRQYAREPVKNLVIEGKTKIQYRLKTGDVLGIIAEKYDVRVADLKYWNNIYNERRIQAGKTLDIFVDDEKADYYLSLANSQKLKNTNVPVKEQTQKSSTPIDLKGVKKVEHIVKSGESPYLIAKQYNGVTPDEILEWNNISDARKIQIGQKLIVYLRE